MSKNKEEIKLNLIPTPVSAMAVANYLISKSIATGVELSPMKLIKMVYFAQGWHLALREKTLLNEAIQAGTYGPFIESILDFLRTFKGESITRLGDLDVSDLEGNHFIFTPQITNQETMVFLDDVWRVYSAFTADQLSLLSANEESPWLAFKNKKGLDFKIPTIIPNDLICQKFLEIYKKSKTEENVKSVLDKELHGLTKLQSEVTKLKKHLMSLSVLNEELLEGRDELNEICAVLFQVGCPEEVWEGNSSEELTPNFVQDLFPETTGVLYGEIDFVNSSLNSTTINDVFNFPYIKLAFQTKYSCPMIAFVYWSEKMNRLVGFFPRDDGNVYNAQTNTAYGFEMERYQKNNNLNELTPKKLRKYDEIKNKNLNAINKNPVPYYKKVTKIAIKQLKEYILNTK